LGRGWLIRELTSIEVLQDRARRLCEGPVEWEVSPGRSDLTLLQVASRIPAIHGFGGMDLSRMARQYRTKGPTLHLAVGGQ